MKKGSNKNTAVVESNETVEAIKNGETGTVTVTEPKKLGRPVNANSARQQKVALIEQRKVENGGIVPLGRPVVPGSKRQEKLMAIEAKKSSGAVIQRGRPKMTEEAKTAAKEVRAKAIAEFKAKQAESGKTE